MKPYNLKEREEAIAREVRRMNDFTDNQVIMAALYRLISENIIRDIEASALRDVLSKRAGL
jgi:hypothetical protein